MKRAFNQHIVRRTADLSGIWRFLQDSDGIGEKNGWYKGLPDGASVAVPSVWNNDIGLLNYEGACWYEKRFYTESPTVRLEFESVMTQADVWLDGVKLGSHYGAFTSFDFIVNDVACGEHILLVRADNSFDELSLPQKFTDWFNYGGIARPVFAEQLRGITVLSNRVIYELSEDMKELTVASELELYNADATVMETPLTVDIGEHRIYSGTVTLGAYEKTTFNTPKISLSGIELWSVDTPKLYTVVARTDTDDLIDRVGFRKIEVKNSDILLNGKPIELLGVNRHEEHPDWGFAFPPRLMKRDLDIISELGCNTVRGSHYPNSKIFVDMLDERGVLFWSEIPIWGVAVKENVLSSRAFVDRGLAMHKEMTRQYYNHPSIIIWGMHNEIKTSLECAHSITKEYSEYLRREGGNRLVTHASNLPFDDSSMEFDDIICLNLYYGWYRGKLDEWDKFVKNFEQHLQSRGWCDKPVIMSEFGAAALAGYHSHFDTVVWSEEYQRDLIEYCLELFHKTPYMRGTYIWQFADVRTAVGELNRARSFNNKGIVDEYRRPKSSYFKIRELYRRFAEE